MSRLKADTLDRVLKHLETFGDTDLFPVPFEFKAIRHSWETEIKPHLLSQDIENWNTRTFRRCLAPKHRYGFRVSTQLDPLDAIFFTSLIYEIGGDIEKTRIPSSKSMVFSYRFKPSVDGRMFDEKYNWDEFQKHSFRLATSGKFKYVVLADIADFYPRLYTHRLENSLFSCTSKHYAKAIMNLIGQWNQKVSYGIPVGIAASRLLAELSIDDVDRVLESYGATHCRYVDDYRIFCENKSQAFERLAHLAQFFDNHGLTLQQHKTKIMKISDFNQIILRTEETQELDSLAEKFYQILASLGIDNQYGELDYDELEPETQEEIDKLNLEEILLEQLEKEGNIDETLMRFLLKRLGQINADCSEIISLIISMRCIQYLKML